MSDLQKLGTLVALIVGLVTIGTGIWSASSNFTQINNKLDLLVRNSDSMNLVLEAHAEDLSMLKRETDELKKEALLFVYLDDEYLVVQTPKGTQLEIPIHVRVRNQ